MRSITTAGAPHDRTSRLPLDGSRNSPTLGRHENPTERVEAVSVSCTAAHHTNKESAMNVNLSLAPLVALLAGILILVMPRLLNYIVAIYLIVTGLLGLFGESGLHGIHMH